jgi:Vacuolar protein sorting-associated protein 35
MQDLEEVDECMVALARLARCLDTSDLHNLQRLAAAFLHGTPRLERTAPLEALCHAFLDVLRAGAQSEASMAAGTCIDAEEFSRGAAFLHSRVAVLLEDIKPEAALRVLLAAAATACAARHTDCACHMLDCAVAVYHRYCALPPHASAGLAALVQGAAELRGLPRERYDALAAQAARFATSLPARDDKVQMLCCVANLHWQEEGGVAAGVAVRDRAAVVRVLDEALELCATAEQRFRGEAWGNPAALYMDVLEATRCLSGRGCDAGDVGERARQEIKRLAQTGPESVAIAEPIPCWSDAIQARFFAIEE